MTLSFSANAACKEAHLQVVVGCECRCGCVVGGNVSMGAYVVGGNVKIGSSGEYFLLLSTASIFHSP